MEWVTTSTSTGSVTRLCEMCDNLRPTYTASSAGITASFVLVDEALLNGNTLNVRHDQGDFSPDPGRYLTSLIISSPDRNTLVDVRTVILGPRPQGSFGVGVYVGPDYGCFMSGRSPGAFPNCSIAVNLTRDLINSDR
jgi:hypothetical protein